MTLQESQKRSTRLIHRDDEDEETFDLRRHFEKREYAPETKYVFHLRTRQKPPKVYNTNFKLWDIISTSNGPYKVVEIFWGGCEKRGWRADVLLKPIDTDEPKKETKDKPARNYKPEKRYKTSRRQK